MSAGVNIPLGNLRAVVILIVVAFHSVLPYLASQPPQPFGFDEPPYRWIAFPLLDRERWFGFDLFCAWQDVSLMSLMFFRALLVHLTFAIFTFQFFQVFIHHGGHLFIGVYSSCFYIFQSLFNPPAVGFGQVNDAWFLHFRFLPQPVVDHG